MAKSQALLTLLSIIRQHPGFQDFLNAEEIRPPSMPRYKKGESLEELGARTAHTSGMRDQYDRFYAFLTGALPQEENHD